MSCMLSTKQYLINTIIIKYNFTIYIVPTFSALCALLSICYLQFESYAVFISLKLIKKKKKH